ncbi:hypothetical protein ACJX0J_009770, partial [Zea mays]
FPPIAQIYVYDFGYMIDFFSKIVTIFSQYIFPLFLIYPFPLDASPVSLFFMCFISFFAYSKALAICAKGEYDSHSIYHSSSIYILKNLSNMFLKTDMEIGSNYRRWQHKDKM